MTTTENCLNSPPDEFHLACLLLSPTGRVHLTDALEKLDPEDFNDFVWGWTWAAARSIHTKGHRVTKRTILAVRDQAPDTLSMPIASPAAAVLAARLDLISGEPAYPTKIDASIKNIQETAKLRRLINTLDRIKAHAITHDYSQTLGIAWDLLGNLEESTIPADVIPFSTLVDDFHKTMAGGLSAGEVIPTPWPELNNLLSGGLHAGRSFIAAGRPGAGKSILGLGMAAHAAEQGFPTLVISEEMSNFEVTGRLMAAGARVEYGEITRYDMSAHTAAAVAEYGDSNREMPLYAIDRPNLTIEYVAAVARTMKRTQGLDLLVIDYLQLLQATDRGKPREQQVAHISRSIKLLSRELGCAIVTLAQLNRDNVKANRRPTLADLRESGSLEQDSDAVILLHHNETDDAQPTGMVTFIVAKSRFGPKNDVELRWRGHQARIGD